MKGDAVAGGPCHFERAFEDTRRIAGSSFHDIVLAWWRSRKHTRGAASFRDFAEGGPFFRDIRRMFLREMKRPLTIEEERTFTHQARLEFTMCELQRTGPRIYRPTRRVLDALRLTKPTGARTPPTNIVPYYVHVADLLDDLRIQAQLEPEKALLAQIGVESMFHLDTALGGFVPEGIYVCPADEVFLDNSPGIIICVAYRPVTRRHKHEADDYSESMVIEADEDWDVVLERLKLTWGGGSLFLADADQESIAARTNALAFLAVTLWQVLDTPGVLRAYRRRATRKPGRMANPKKARRHARTTTSHRYVEVDLSEDMVRRVEEEDNQRREHVEGDRASPRFHWVGAHYKWVHFGPGKVKKTWKRIAGYPRGTGSGRAETTIIPEGG